MSTEWIWVLVIAGAIAMFWINRSEKKGRLESTNWQLQRTQERVNVAQRFYLEILQREAANIIMAEDLEAFEKAYYWMRNWQYEIAKADKDRRIAERKLLFEKFPNLEDFDLVGIKHFLEDELGIEVDVMTRDSLHPMLRDDIEKSAVRVF